MRPQFPVFSRVFALDMRATCATGALTRSDGCPDTPGARNHAFVRRECHLARNTTRYLLRGAACPGGRTQPISAPPALQAPPPRPSMHPNAPPRVLWTALPPLPPCPSRPCLLCPRLAPFSAPPRTPTEGPSEYLPTRHETPTPKPPRCPTAWQWVRGSQAVLYVTTLCHLPAIWCPSPIDSTPEMPSGADGPYRWLIWLPALSWLPHLVHTKVWHQYT